MSRPLLHSQRAIFIHVPKTGGVSIDRFFRDRCGLESFTGHHAASELRAAYPDEFSTYFKFAFVRNPWDRLVSAFHFMAQGGYSKVDLEIKKKYIDRYDGDFTRFVHDLPSSPHFVHAPSEAREKYADGLPFDTAHFVEQAYWLCDERDTVLVDYVGRFERLGSDFEEVRKAVGLPEGDLDVANASRHGHYRSCYTDETRQIVASLYARDIALFQYEF